MCFSQSKYFFSHRSQAGKKIHDKLSRHYFFSAKTIFLKALRANRIFFSAHVFSIKFADIICFPQKKQKAPPPPTPFNSNGCSLINENFNMEPNQSGYSTHLQSRRYIGNYNRPSSGNLKNKLERYSKLVSFI